MAANVNYRNSNTTLGYSQTDLIQLLVPREYFNQGGIYSWGAATNGALGNSSTVSRSSPGVLSLAGQTSWEKISIKGSSGGAVRSDGTLWTWGTGTYGVLGNNSATSISIPATVSGGGTTWEEVEASATHMLGIKNDGTLWSWGRNSNGQLGTNSTTSRSSPGTTSGSVSTGGDWRIAAAGGNNSAAIKIDGTLWTWGYNSNGMLGDGSTTARSSPATTAGGGTNWEIVSISNQTGVGAFMAGVKSDGTLWTWGGNSNGVLGDGSTTSRSSPATTAGGGTNWDKVSCGYSHVVATKLDGTLWTWGLNSSGCLGVGGTLANRSSPGTTAGGGTTWKIARAGNGVTGCIKSDGTLWTWGSNSFGQLGDGGTTARSSPQTVSGSLVNWIDVSISAITTSTTTLGLTGVEIFHFPEINVYPVPGNYTETIPEGNHTALIEVWGAGGPGGDGYSDGGLNNYGGGGGGSGGYSRTMTNVAFQVNKTMSITIGAGGVAQIDLSGANSNVKSGTYIVTTIESGGGAVGNDASIGGIGLGGQGGPSSGGTDVNTTGTTGSPGNFGAGGSGAAGVSGRNSFAYGAGGAGGTPPSAGIWAGLNGSNGAVVITYL